MILKCTYVYFVQESISIIDNCPLLYVVFVVTKKIAAGRGLDGDVNGCMG